MKKIIVLFFVSMFLLGCEKETAYVKKEEIGIKKEEAIAKIKYLDEDDLKFLIRESNKVTNVIEIEMLHEMLIKQLLVELDLDVPIDEQEELIDNVVREVLYDWKYDVVKNIIAENKIEVNDNDFDTIMKRTSISNALDVMKAYEIIYLKKHND